MSLVAASRRCFLVCGVVFFAATLNGCTGLTSLQNENEALLQRAKEFWKAVQANDLETAWKYEELSKKPAWTLQAYVQRGGVIYEAVQVLEVRSMEADRAQIDVKISYSLPLLRMNKKEVVLKDEWVRLDGHWYHADRKGLL